MSHSDTWHSETFAWADRFPTDFCGVSDFVPPYLIGNAYQPPLVAPKAYDWGLRLHGIFASQFAMENILLCWYCSWLPKRSIYNGGTPALKWQTDLKDSHLTTKTCVYRKINWKISFHCKFLWAQNNRSGSELPWNPVPLEKMRLMTKAIRPQRIDKTAPIFALTKQRRGKTSGSMQAKKWIHRLCTSTICGPVFWLCLHAPTAKQLWNGKSQIQAACPRISGWTNASFATKRATVRPMPPRASIATSSCRVLIGGGVQGRG